MRMTLHEMRQQHFLEDKRRHQQERQTDELRCEEESRELEQLMLDYRADADAVLKKISAGLSTKRSTEEEVNARGGFTR